MSRQPVESRDGRARIISTHGDAWLFQEHAGGRGSQHPHCDPWQTASPRLTREEAAKRLAAWDDRGRSPPVAA